MMRIRLESAADMPGIRRAHQLAFDSGTEARIVDRLREVAEPVISLVADDDGIVGHIVFSPIARAQDDGVRVMALGPMAVTPDRQRQGIGSALVVAGLDECRRRGVGGVVVIGHAEFYPRCGFLPASSYGLTCEFEVPDDAFMAIELVESSLDQGGMIHFHPAFSEA